MDALGAVTVSLRKSMTEWFCGLDWVVVENCRTANNEAGLGENRKETDKSLAETPMNGFRVLECCERAMMMTNNNDAGTDSLKQKALSLTKLLRNSSKQHVRSFLSTGTSE